MPLLIPFLWVALGSAIGGGAVLAGSDAADEFGDAVEQSTDSVRKLMVTGAVIAAGYVAYQNRAAIGKMFK